MLLLYAKINSETETGIESGKHEAVVEDGKWPHARLRKQRIERKRKEEQSYWRERSCRRSNSITVGITVGHVEGVGAVGHVDGGGAVRAGPVPELAVAVIAQHLIAPPVSRAHEWESPRAILHAVEISDTLAGWCAA